jgi:hypothetical protein
VPEIRATGEYFQRDLVFVGTVTSGHYSLAGGMYRLSVQRIFRGPIQKEFTVYTWDDDVRFPLKTGATYLLFASKDKRGFEIDSCGNSNLLSHATKTIRELQMLSQAAPFGVIEGWVVAETDGIDVSGVRVTVKGKAGVYSAVTDKDGWFHFRAPVGEYKVDFSSGEYYLNAADDFRYDPEGFELHAGETASLQVVSVRHLHQ